MNLPNKLTMLRMVMVPFFVAAMVLESLPGARLAALILFVAASLTDLLDGKIARSRGLVTDFGKLMDPLADKLLVMSALVMMMERMDLSGVVVIILLAREFLVTSLRLIAASGGKVIAAGKGQDGGADGVDRLFPGGLCRGAPLVERPVPGGGGAGHPAEPGVRV